MRVSRFQPWSANWLYMYQSPVCGSYGAAPGRSHFTGAELANCGKSAGGRKLEVASRDAVWSWLSAESPPLKVPANPSKAPAAPLTGNGPSSAGAAVAHIVVGAQPVLLEVVEQRQARVVSGVVHSGGANGL